MRQLESLWSNLMPDIRRSKAPEITTNPVSSESWKDIGFQGNAHVCVYTCIYIFPPKYIYLLSCLFSSSVLYYLSIYLFVYRLRSLHRLPGYGFPRSPAARTLR